ncbi:MAG TPA: SMC family ATPase [Jatrophihabitans sp.]|jgi:exonuclease SbcC|uniref:AAA family ATPase n=1 Tax=Jatrophihabitans sp. TaxID=1932789 RepID=UPI002EF2AF54
MRLHRLSMTAIGPYADHVEIDFSQFGAGGLFLLEGPNGSGKSTVLDAISFALYGKLAQRSATVERLKSQHAPPSCEPVVELIFETQSGLFRIRRTPSHQRPKKKGAGTTPAHMTVKLWRLGSLDQPDGGVLLSANLGDTEDEITRAVGLTHGQFVQTVLLPQGEFANFLQASTNDRRALLQRLFGTELLARTQDALVEGRRAAEQRRAATNATVAKAVHALAGATGLAEDVVGELAGHCESGDCAGVTALLAGVREQLAAVVSAADERRAGAAQARTQSAAEVQRAQDLAARRAVRGQLRAERERLLAEGDAHQAACAELAAAERALRVLPAAEALALAGARCEQAEHEAAAARARLAEPLRELPGAGLRAEAARGQTTLGALADAVSRERRLSSQQADHQQLQHDLAAQRRLRERAAQRLAELPLRQAELTETRNQAALAAGRLADLTAERDRAQTRLAAARQAVAAAKVAAENQQLAQELFDAAEGQRARLDALRLSWRASIASELGMALQSGQECVVCGSLEHPKPARPTDGHVSQELVNSAEDELRRLTAQVETRRVELAEQRGELLELQIRADQLTPERAQAKLDQADAGLAAAQAAADRQRDLDEELAEIAEQLAAQAEQAHQAAVAETRLTERCAALTDTIAENLKVVTEAREDYPSVADRVTALTNQLALLDEAAAASSAVATAAVAEAEARQRFQAALTDAEFDELAAWDRARRSSSEVAELRARIRAYQQRLDEVGGRLSAAELTDPQLDAPPADLAQLTEQLRSAEAAEAAASAEHGAAASRLADAVSHAERLEAAVRRGARVLAETAVPIRIGNLVAGLGDNQLKMELTTYVLVRRFTEIVSAANSQLRRISGGRYELEHTSERTGNSRSGLGLRILDLHTGRTRDPGTLSGGETFYVSLSLALGLADIVRAESGGVDLGTLLIDEGFGSLDPDVLDQVLAVLDSLREGGRAVGVVSHVEEIKRRIADQIQVRPNPDGSSRLVSTLS